MHWGCDAQRWPILDEDGVHFDELKLGMLTAFDHFDHGYEALSWWAFQPRSTGTKAAFIMSELVQSTLGGTLLPTDDGDGVEVNPQKLNSRAFKTGAKRITLWVSNDAAERAGQWTEIEGREIESAAFLQWTPSSPNEGDRGDGGLVGNPWAFAMSYPANSITRVAITLK